MSTKVITLKKDPNLPNSVNLHCDTCTCKEDGYYTSYITICDYCGKQTTLVQALNIIIYESEGCGRVELDFCKLNCLRSFLRARTRLELDSYKSFEINFNVSRNPKQGLDLEEFLNQILE